MKEIKIVVTMDCEPTTATTHPTATGPGDWELGERAAVGYANIAREFGFPVTYFVHPETAIAQAKVYTALREQGACLGLHMHPWKYSMWRYDGKRFMAHYGELSADEQRELLSESSALWQEALGTRPLYFRPGTFSANDSIFKVLAELGFRGGSCSVPGRMMPEMQAIWTGALLDAHRGNDRFRQIAGELDFVNMPLAVDTSELLEARRGRKLHPDLRPDIDWLAQYGLDYDTIATRIVEQVMARAPAVPVINVVSHNHYDYADRAVAESVRMTASLTALVRACEKAGVRPVGATLADVVSDMLALPIVREPFVCEGNIVER